MQRFNLAVQRRDGLPVLLFGKFDMMVVEYALREGAALALLGFQDDHMRLARRLLRLRDCGLHGFYIVAVDLLRVPAEILEFLPEVAYVAHVARIAVKLLAVAVDKCDQMVKLLLVRPESAFPNLPFFAFAVAQHQKGIVVMLLAAVPPGNPQRGRHALPERTSGHIDARREVPVTMAGQAGAGLVDGRDFLHGEEAAHGKRRVQRGAAVPFGDHQPVAPVPFRVLRVVLHYPAVKHRHQVGHAHGTADMPRA